jgi:hypothetical protein
MTGFFNVPGDVEQRQKEMNNFMKDFLVQNLNVAF